MGDRERTRAYEQREAKVWEKAGWLVQLNWRQAIFIGKGKLITKPKDFFDGFDLLAVHPFGRVAFVQVTGTPFARLDATHPGWADRNAGHGEPPFSFRPEMLEVPSVDAWMRDPTYAETRGGALGTVIVSYADARKPERHWWTRAPTKAPRATAARGSDAAASPPSPSP